tara:strand:+ start:382 stop:1296 length:915 start_codon:yes stop_codon:yes gene_type:complete
MHLNENSSKPRLLSLCVLLFVSLSEVNAQSFENLNHLAGHHTKTYFSEGSKEQAETMATRCDSVISFYKSLIDFEPKVTLLVLSAADWNQYTNFPVYGMPHYNDAQTLVVASDDNDFWKSFIPPLDQLPYELKLQILNTYSDKNSSLTMRSFFDLLAIHELGHAFHSQGGLTMQRKWMGELFANILLHTYIAEKEPGLLPALTVFPKMVVSSANKEELKYTTLEDLESNYDLIGQQYPKNYGWFQCRWHMAAGNIYDVGGITAFQNLWHELKNQKNPLDDSTLATLLAEKVHKSVADVQLKWNE